MGINVDLKEAGSLGLASFFLYRLYINNNTIQIC